MKLYIYAAHYFPHGIPNKTQRKHKHIAPNNFSTLFLHPSKIQMLLNNITFIKHVLPNTIALEIPNELHHSPDHKPLESWF
jgi:hypothetical protein